MSMLHGQVLFQMADVIASFTIYVRYEMIQKSLQQPMILGTMWTLPLQDKELYGGAPAAIAIHFFLS